MGCRINLTPEHSQQASLFFGFFGFRLIPHFWRVVVYRHVVQRIVTKPLQINIVIFLCHLPSLS